LSNLTIFNAKPLVDTEFQSNWTETPIQYDGADFAEPSADWIAIALIPTDRKTVGFDGTLGGRKSEEGIIRVRAYAKSATQALHLTGKVATFLECREFAGVSVGVCEPDGGGAVPLENGLYETETTFNVRIIT